MKVDRPVVRARDLDRVVLLVDKPMKDLRGTWVHRYLKYGETATFPSKKSKAVPVPQRSTCAARDPWYDLTKLVKPGFAFWPMAQQYRHIIAGNPEQLTCNHNLFDLSSDLLSKRETAALCALLNSSLIGLFKTFYGRWAGTEGNLKTEVVDVNLLDVPDPRGIDRAVADRLAEALKSLSRRPIGRLVESQLMERMPPERARRIGAGPVALPEELKQDDRRALDDACFEHLGVSDAAERTDLIERLYRATALHFRQIRVVEIEKQEQRTKAANKRFSAQELAADAWDAAALEDAVPLAEWVGRRPECTKMVHIPDERPAALSSSPMFDPETVYFGLKRQHHVECASVEEARLVVRLAELGLSGNVAIPADEGACQALRHVLNKRHNETLKRLDELARSRIGNEKLQAQVIDQLVRWFVHGRVATLAPTDGSTSNESGESDG
jgi:hypothetical protein